MIEHLEESRAGMVRKFIKYIKGTGRWFRKGGRNIWVPNSRLRDTEIKKLATKKNLNPKRYVKKSFASINKGASPSTVYNVRKVPKSNLMRNQVPDTLSSMKKMVKKGWDNF